MPLRLFGSFLWICILFSCLFRAIISQMDEELEEEDCPIDPAKEDLSGFLAGVIIVYTICLTCAIVLIIYLIQFYRNRTDPNIENRHPRIVYATVSIVIFSNIILFPFAIEFWTLECVTHTKWLRRKRFELYPMESFLMVTFILVLLGWLILVVLRVWLLRYDYAASLARKGQIWKKDLGIAGGSSTWWIHNQQTWGNETYLLKKVSIPYISAVILSILLSPIFQFIHQIEGWTPMVSAVGGISLLLWGFICVNVWKVREIHDNFHIKHEVLLFAKCSLMIAFLLLLIFIVSRAFDSEYLSAYIVLIWGILVMFLLTTVSYIQTGWVLYGIRRKNEKSEKLVKSIADEWESNISLSTVLESKEGFEIFMDFLVAEYSTENLLCYVEATQFLRKWKFVVYRMKVLTLKQKTTDTEQLVSEATNYVQKQMGKDAPNDGDVDSQPWSFHDKESILIKFQWVKKPPVMTQEGVTLWEHFKHLRQKYISATSAHQVNIRSALYKHYTEVRKEDCKLATLDMTDIFDDEEMLQHPMSSPSGLDKIMNTMQLLTKKSASVSDDEDEEEHKVPHRKKDKERVQSYDDIPTLAGHSPQTTRNLRNLYGVTKVLQLIEDTRKELWKNMNDSFVRFRSTEKYVNYIKKIYINDDTKTPQLEEDDREHSKDADGYESLNSPT
eukprot:542657_1